MLAGKALIGTPILLLEGAGAVVACVGAVLCALDEHRDHAETGSDVSQAWIGDVLAMTSALFGGEIATLLKTNLLAS